MPAIDIRIVKTMDPAYRQVWALREEVLRSPLGLSLRNEDLNGEASETILAAFAEGEKLTGCLLMRRISEVEVKLRQMAVAPEARGRGIGRLLMQKAETLALERGFLIITLHARHTALPFYEKAGYVAEGDVFEEVGIPHLFMKKDIHAPLP